MFVIQYSNCIIYFLDACTFHYSVRSLADDFFTRNDVENQN